MAFEIGSLEASSLHLLADLMELLALLGYDGRVSYHPDDITSIIEGQPDFEDHEPRDLPGSVRNAWPHFEYRARRFGNAYPFTVRGGALRVRPRLTPAARIYRLLLVCSRLRSFPHAQRLAWAAAFVRLSQHVLTQLMPSWATVRVFDANSDDRRDYFGTDLRDALLVLGKDLAVTMINEQECRAQSASGDAKIDLVAVAAWDDKASGIHAMLAQCAARETEWPSKRLEAHPVGLRGLFGFLTDPVNAHFIPVLCRDTNGMWITETSASGCLLVDRLRILLLLERRGRLQQLVAEAWFQAFEQEFSEVVRGIVPAAA